MANDGPPTSIRAEVTVRLSRCEKRPQSHQSRHHKMPGQRAELLLVGSGGARGRSQHSDSNWTLIGRLWAQKCRISPCGSTLNYRASFQRRLTSCRAVNGDIKEDTAVIRRDMSLLFTEVNRLGALIRQQDEGRRDALVRVDRCLSRPLHRTTLGNLDNRPSFKNRGVGSRFGHKRGAHASSIKQQDIESLPISCRFHHGRY